MQDAPYPTITLDQAATRLGWETFQRGTAYARKGWVLQSMSPV